MAKKPQYPLYDITPSQRTMYMLVKFSIHKQVTQLPLCVTVKERMDIPLLIKALNIEFSRNDALRIRFTKVDKEIKQYFLPEFRVKSVPFVTFRSKEEQDKFFGKDAKKPVYIMNCVPYRLYFFRTHEGYTGIYFNISHVVTDALGGALFYSDLLAVYRALKNGTPMPAPLSSFEDYVQTELKYLADDKKHGKDRDWYIHYWTDNGEPFYAGIHGHGLLDKARKKDPAIRVPPAYDPIHDKAEVIRKSVSADITNGIYDFCRKNTVVPESVFIYALRAHASKVNYRADDVLSIFMCSRRATVKAKSTGGCLAQPMQLRTITDETDTFTEAVNKVSKCRNDLIRHMNFPYLEARFLQTKIHNYKTSQGPSCFMFSWLPINYAAERSDIDLDFTAYCMGRYVMPLYIFAVPEPKSGKTDFYYMYRTHFIKPEHIDLLHENMVKALESGLADPDITVGNLLDKLDDFEY